MNELRYSGIEVSVPNSLMISRDAAPCNLLLKITPDTIDKALDIYRVSSFSFPFQGFRLENIDDYSFLEEFPLLLYLEVNSEDKIPTESIHTLNNLRGLSLSQQKNGFDFSAFPHLETFIGEWHRNNHSISLCKKLRNLHLRKFNPKSKDFSDLVNLEQLEYLDIIQSNVESICGIETMNDLLSLSMSYFPKLRELKPLAALSSTLRHLELDRVPNICSYRSIGALSRLRKLKLSSSASMEDLKWIKELELLTFFSFVETIVKNGDLKPLLKLASLKYVGTENKRIYNMTMEEINKILNAES